MPLRVTPPAAADGLAGDALSKGGLLPAGCLQDDTVIADEVERLSVSHAGTVSHQQVIRQENGWYAQEDSNL